MTEFEQAMSHTWDVRWVVIAFYIILFGVMIWGAVTSIREHLAKTRHQNDEDPPDSEGRHLRLVR